jgi:hypothetical protein
MSLKHLLTHVRLCINDISYPLLPCDMVFTEGDTLIKFLSTFYQDCFYTWKHAVSDNVAGVIFLRDHRGCSTGFLIHRTSSIITEKITHTYSVL